MDTLLLTVACLVAVGSTFTPPDGWYVDVVTPKDTETRVVLSTIIAYAEPFRWPQGCKSVSLEPIK